jgi:saccharopine dehydrogenase-like NADP-dependent oxidoreductase
MEALRVIREAQAAGGKVESFLSYCGGLPAPEANDNPLGYKFSWSPRGVLLASRNSARFLKDGRIVTIPAERLFASPALIGVPGLGNFEGYPNRDSAPYIETYGIPEARTCLRGTLRWPGWCETLMRLGEVGYLDLTERPLSGMTYGNLLYALAGASGGTDPRQAAAAKLGLPADAPVLNRLAWLGLYDDEPVPLAHGSPLDVLTARMVERLKYKPGERDMIVLRHEFLVRRTDGRLERIQSTLIDYGVPGGDSSMSRTVGLPVAIAARLVLEGRIRRTGVLIPTFPEAYLPILAELRTLGIEFREERDFPA